MTESIRLSTKAHRTLTTRTPFTRCSQKSGSSQQTERDRPRDKKRARKMTPNMASTGKRERGRGSEKQQCDIIKRKNRHSHSSANRIRIQMDKWRQTLPLHKKRGPLPIQTHTHSQSVLSSAGTNGQQRVGTTESFNFKQYKEMASYTVTTKPADTPSPTVPCPTKRP